MGRTFPRAARLRSCLVVGASFAALAVSQNAHAQAQLCPNGQPGPVCTIENTGTSGPIVGTNGNVTVVINSGTIIGAPAITKAGSAGLFIDNQEGGTITGTSGTAIQSGLGLIFRTVNSGTINGDVVFNDAPGPNAFTNMLVYYVSDGGVLNGNLQLGTSGFLTANFLMRGADDGVTGTISAGAGIDIFTKIYESSQTLTLGQYALPATFEVEGYLAEGVDTVLTLNGTGTTISLSGEGSVINNATINPVDPTGLYAPGADVVPNAIAYYQPSNAVFPRQGIAPGQPGSFFTLGYGNALTSFTNNGVLNADINLATASFVNTGDINLRTHAVGSTVYSAADTAFTFENSGSIVMTANGNRIPTALGEFDDGLAAALRLRSAINTTEASSVTVLNSGSIVGGLDARLAATDFVFENTGSIEGIDNPGGYSTPGLFLNVGKLRLVLGQNPETHYDAATASILNSSTGSIDHYFEAQLSARAITFVNDGFIAGSDTNPDALFVGQTLDEGEGTSFSFVNTGDFEGNVGLEGYSATFSVDNSGTITGDEFAVNTTTFPTEIMWGGDTAFEIYNGTSGDHTLSFDNTGSIATTGHAASGVAIEVEAGDGDPDPGDPLIISDALVTLTNRGTISATGGATLVTQQFASWLQPGQFLINPLAALAVDATDVSGDSVISITNEAGGLIQAGGTLHSAAPNGYTAITQAQADVFTVAVAATGKTINITNAGTIQGGAGTTIGANAVLNEVDLYDAYLAGAIQTTGDEYVIDGVEVYVASIDHVTNTATGTIIGSIDLGGNDDRIDNAGSITGAVFLRDGDDSLYNYGTLTGDIQFGAGADLFVQGIQATLNGTADGGEGDDRFLLDITAGGTIDQSIYTKLLNFETLALTGTGTVDVDLGDSDDEVANDGTIDGDVGLGSGSNEFQNSGTVTGDVTSGEGDDEIGNEGTIEGSVVLGDGANEFANTGTVNGDVTGGAGGDTVQNDGEVNGTVDLGDGANEFANTGTVNGGVTGGTAGDTVQNDGDINGTVDLGDGTNEFANTGTLTGDLQGGGDADTVENEGAINGTVDLGGGSNTFANAGEVNGNVIGGDDSDSIANDGTINGDLFLDSDTLQPAALAFFKTTQALGGGDDEFTNTDTLNGSVFAGGGDDVITNSGTITGDVDLGDGNDTLELLGGWEIGGTANGGTGSDTLDLTFGTTATAADFSNFVSFETLEVSGGIGLISGDASFGQINLAGGRLIGDHESHITANVQVGSGATFGSAGEVTGNIAVASGGTLSPGASPAVMTVTGNVSLASGSATLFEFVPAPGQSDQLLIDGNLTIASGAVLNMTGSRPLTPGVAYDMIIADAITGQFTVGTWDRNAIQGFLRYLDGTSDDRLQLLGTFVAEGDVNPQASAAIDYVNELLVSGEASTALLGSVSSLLDSNGFASEQAFTLLTPEPYASATQLGIESGLSLAKASRDGMGTTERETAGLFAIVNAFGNWRSLDADTVLGTSKAKNRNYGLVGGIGYGNASASVGGFVGYIEGRQRIEALGSETDADGFTAGLTGHFGSAGFSLDALIGYDWGEAETARVVPGAAAVSSGYDLENLVLDAVASYELPLGGMALTPAVGITHIETKRGTANETGSAAFALDVDSDKHSSTFVDGSIAIRGTAGGIRPWAEVGIRYQLDGELAFASAALTGATTRFFVPGAPRDDTVFTAGAGIEASLAPNVSLTASYNGEFGGGTGTTGAIGLKVAF